MPELPDLEVFSKNLTKRFKGKTLEKIKFVQKTNLKTSDRIFKKTIECQKLNKVYREGKELRFLFGKNRLGLHLMLHGELHVSAQKNDQKHTIAEMHFSNKEVLSVTDWQRKANLTLNPEEKNSPDALSAEVNSLFLKQKMAIKKVNIKKFLMDQTIIRGIGNAYADEILYAAKIHPLSICNKIPASKISTLSKAIKTVLQNAIKKIEKKDPDRISGEVRDFLLVHNHRKEISPKGFPLIKTQVNNRPTYFTDEQKLFS